MTKHRSRSAGLNYPRPTFDDLVLHAKTFGLDNRTDTFRGKPRPYKSYTALAKDALVEVAFDFFGENTYATFVEALGYSQFSDEARKDWRDHHGD